MNEQSRLSILVAWEIGGGFGHLMRLRPIVERLVQRGHRVTLVVRDLEKAQEIFPDLACLQTPQRSGQATDYPQVASLAEIMYNCGFNDQSTVQRLCASWRAIGELVRPDVVIMDFSPMALLAFQASPVRRVLIDNGYSHPTMTARMPDLRPWQRGYVDLQAAIEDDVRQSVNAFLVEQGLEPVEALSALFRRVDSINLMTLPELDHTGPKTHVAYRGYAEPGGPPPPWPETGARPRVLVYLRPFAGIGELLSRLGGMNWAILAIVPGHDQQLKARLAGVSNLHLTEALCDIHLAARQADLAVCAGGDTVGIMLLGATPVCVVPYHAEQYLTAWRAEKTGAAVTAGNPSRLPPRSDEIITALNRLISNPDHYDQASEFAARYKDLDPARELTAIITEIEGQGFPET